jgi:TonB-dependent receptor
MLALAMPTAAAHAQAETSEAAAEPPKDATPDVSNTGEQEIVVAGYRASLIKSLDIKKRAQGIVDAISAEDINSFPDQNVVEALARITGVQITRDSNGEGDRFQVRGLSDVRIEVDGQKQVGGRFDGGVVGSALPSELYGKVEVFKTQSADQTEGGTGAIVRFSTLDPLDYKRDYILSGTAEQSYSGNADRWGYKVSATAAKKFLNTGLGDIGVLFSYTRNNTKGRADQFTTNGYLLDTTVAGDFNGNGTPGEQPTKRAYLGNSVVDNFGDGVVAPIGSVGANYTTINRTEQSFNGSIDWRPTPTLQFYAKATFTRQNNDNDNLSFTQGIPALSGFKQSSLVIENQVFRAGEAEGIGGPAVGESFNKFNLKQDTFQAGVRWDVSSRFHASLKYEYGSGSTFNPLRIPILGGLSFANYNAFIDLRPAVPIVKISDPATGNPFDFTRAVGPNYNPFVIGIFDADLRERQRDYAVQADFRYDLDWSFLKSIEFGARRNIQVNGLSSKLYSQFQFNNNAPLLPFRFRQLSGLLAEYPQIPVKVASVEGAFGGRADLPTAFNVIDPTFFFSDFYNNTIRSNNFTKPDGTTAGPLNNPGDQRDGQYRIWAGYAKLNLDGSLFGVKFRGNTGLRVVNTKAVVAGTTLGGDLDTLLNDPTVELSTGAAGFLRTNDTQFLPSIMLAFDLSRSLTLRLGAGRTMSRVGLEILTPIDSLNKTNQGTIRLSNPNLKPVLVTGLDMSLEWYFAKDGLLSVAGFYKKQKNLTAQFNRFECLRNDVNPAITPDQQNPGQFVVNQTSVNICTAAGRGSDADLRRYSAYSVTSFENIGSNTIKGVEVSAQKTFSFLPKPFDGLGVLANYTYTTGDNPLVSPLGLPLPLLGLSRHSINGTIYYEKKGFSTRVSYNYRSKYLDNGLTGLQLNIGPSPAIRAGYGQLDASMSYTVNDRITFTADGINLTSQDQVNYADFPGAVLTRTTTDRRCYFGVKVGF